MGKGVIALLAAISGTVWIYNKFMKNTGNLTQRSMIAAGAAGLVIFIVLLIVLSLIGF
ncbi:MAG TPA: hypothetical protein VFB03_00480 [Candidatus Saccharimonadales bacterium]|nr:hypothetical protein [Candidatus Saccharimonadales bacterium]